MKDDFAKYLTRFFTSYLSGERGLSHNTIRAYGNTFLSFIDFMEKYREEQEKIEKCRKQQEEKRLALYDKCASKITDSSLIYQMCALRIMQRF